MLVAVVATRPRGRTLAGFSIAGLASASFVGTFTSPFAAWTAAGGATVSFVGVSGGIAAAALTSAGTATASFTGIGAITAALSSAGAATASFVGESTIAGQWALVGSWTHSTDVAQVDFTGLAGYSEIRVLVRLVTATNAAQRRLLVSTDNGSTFLSASGDYIEVSSAGVETNAASVLIHQFSVTSARGGEVVISGWNLTDDKLVQVRNRTDTRQVVIPTASALNALRINNASGDLTGGSIYVWAR